MIWGAEEIFEMNLFFPGNPFRRNSFFPGEGPPNFFFLNFLRPHPKIINGRPLTPTKRWDLLGIKCAVLHTLSSVTTAFEICLPKFL